MITAWSPLSSPPGGLYRVPRHSLGRALRQREQPLVSQKRGLQKRQVAVHTPDPQSGGCEDRSKLFEQAAPTILESCGLH
ncbi:hypothetical protein NDU88_002301 [Pleurodeles waltl]|uniref:Uncharacterized protein n=1 Tax=Pleurodeles waltl TaxID=8319 RepID=A0AAV7T2S9_PLEWA|nr:hypothetical protein NDU88_002301 [Pleurodeles waltl]